MDKLQKTVSKPKREKGTCFTCGDTNHMYKDCPKREKGACFICGDIIHMKKDCPKRTQSDVNVVNKTVSRKSEFTEPITLSVKCAEVNYQLQLNVLIDTGSPITFIKERHVPPGLMRVVDMSNEFCGINSSKLKLLGTVRVDITLRDKKKKMY